MEPVTHALTSIALGRAGLNRLTRAATPMLLVSGLIADVDWVTRFGGAETFLRGHRTATHSLLGTAAIAVVVGAFFWLAGRKYSKFAVGNFAAVAICAIGAGMHLLLDLLNSYGVQLLWPFNHKWYAWDLVSPADGWILFFLLAGLLLPELFRLVSEEIGSKSKRDSRRRGAIVSLIFVALFVCGRALAHERTIAILDSREYRGQAPLVVGAFPSASNPLMWSGIVGTDNAIVVAEVPLVPWLKFDPESASVHFKPEMSLTLRNAIASPVTAQFLNFARFPLASVERDGDGFHVRVRDMRFVAEAPGQREILAAIDLNPESAVTGSHLEFNSGAGN